MVSHGHHLTFAFDADRIAPSVDRVARYFGGSRYRPKPDVCEQISNAIESTVRLIKPRGAAAVYEVVSFADQGVLHLVGERRLRLPCFSRSHAPRALAVGVATLGSELEQRCRRLAAANQVYESTLFDAVGTAMLDLLEQQLRSLLHEYAHEADLYPGPRFSPGLEGYPLEHQERLFTMVAADSIGVGLNEAFIMVPVKSISFFQLFVPEPYQGGDHLKCRSCSLTQCLYRNTG